MDKSANLIRYLREQVSMTQEEFAHKVAVTVTTVNRWEKGRAQPSKLAWKAIRTLARRHGLGSDVDRELRRNRITRRAPNAGSRSA